MNCTEDHDEIPVTAAFLLAAQRASLTEVAFILDRSVPEVQRLMAQAGLAIGDLPAFAAWVRAEPERRRMFAAFHPVVLQIWTKTVR